ncbi:hypothetical protein MK079_02140 [Candidatus Gracilibacteria bacterium]|nr:hypothetical protein [Candidatus Gracilibacteria bacterium]
MKSVKIVVVFFLVLLGACSHTAQHKSLDENKHHSERFSEIVGKAVDATVTRVLENRYIISLVQTNQTGISFSVSFDVLCSTRSIHQNSGTPLTSDQAKKAIQYICDE